MDVHVCNTKRIGRNLLYALAVSAVIVGLFLASRFNYLLFHGLVEVFSVAVAWNVFFLAWNTRKIAGSDHYTSLGVVYLFVGLFDLIHTLAYGGMGVFPGDLAANYATQLWISARSVEVVGLLFYSLPLKRQIPVWAVFWGGAGVVTLLLTAILWWDIFPTCFIDGEGLTPFKKVAEYTICLTICGAMVLLASQRKHMTSSVFQLMVAAMAVTAVSEFLFTLYADIYGLANFAGHCLKLLSFSLVYMALVRTSLIRPYTTIFGKLTREKERLATRKQQLGLLQNVSRLFLRSEDFDRTLATLPDLISSHFKAPMVAIEFYDAARQEMVFVSATGIEASQGQTLRIPAVETISGTVARTGEAFFGLDVRDHPDYCAEALKAGGAVTFACVPMVGREALIGTLAIAARRKDPDILAAADLLKILGRNLALEIERSRSCDENQTLLAHSPAYIIEVDWEGRILYANRVPEGMSRTDVIGESMYRFIKPEYCQTVANKVRHVFTTGMSEVYDVVGLGPHGKDRHYNTTVAPLRIQAEKVVSVILLAMDVSRRKMAEEKLDASERRYRHLYETMTQGVLLRDAKGQIIDANPAACDILGLSGERLQGSTPCAPQWKLIHPDGSPYDPAEMPSNIALGTGEPVKEIESRIYLPERDQNRWIIVGSSPWFEAGEPQPSGTVTVFTDTTLRKHIEDEREAGVRLLEIINAHTKLPELMRATLQFMKQLSGCEAVGIRLRDGDDFPYYETSGFSQEFVLAETHLCTPDLEGQAQRDELGNAILDCMCGNILCGRFDPSRPFFTDYGSFISNCTTELLATTSEADRQARTRNRCNGEGYESVCLVPLRSQEETFGLLQFNDRRKGLFSSAFIVQAERHATNLAIALAQRRAEEMAREKQNLLQGIFSTTPGMLVLKNREGVYLSVNTAFCLFLNRAEDEIVGKTDHDLFPATEAELYRAGDAKVMATGEAEKGDWKVTRSVGSQWVHVIKVPVMDESGNCTGVLCSVTDISDRKQAELQNLEYQKQLKALASELVLAEECERRRLAELLHDEVCQDLAYAKLRVQMLGQTLTAQVQLDDIGEITQTLSRVMQEARSLTYELSVPVLREFGLKTALARWLEEQIERKHGFETIFTDDNRPKPLKKDVEALLFRSARELLANVVKHSQAKRVEVSTARQGAEILISIEDDGKGFAPNEVVIGQDQGGFGLFSIRERFSQIGGVMEIESCPGQGCKATLRAPLASVEGA